MELFCSVLHEGGHQDIQAGAHMECLNSRGCCSVQAQLHSTHNMTAENEVLHRCVLATQIHMSALSTQALSPNLESMAFYASFHHIDGCTDPAVLNGDF